MLLTQSTAYNVPLFLITAATGIVVGITGLTVAVTSSVAGAAFSTITPVVTELAGGWYNVALTAAHTATLGVLIVRGTGNAGVQVSLPLICQVIGFSIAQTQMGTDTTTLHYSRYGN